MCFFRQFLMVCWNARLLNSFNAFRTSLQHLLEDVSFGLVFDSVSAPEFAALVLWTPSKSCCERKSTEKTSNVFMVCAVVEWSLNVLL